MICADEDEVLRTLISGEELNLFAVAIVIKKHEDSSCTNAHVTISHALSNTWLHRLRLNMVERYSCT
jgi:hypothetical protein